jgi:hypothetical protein
MSNNLQFSHSGTFGDIIYSLQIVKHLGGGDYFLRLHNIDNMARETFGPNANAGDHSGEMSMEQHESLVSFMAAQPYIKSYGIYQEGQHIDHALEYSGREIVKRQGNYAWGYARAAGVNPAHHFKEFMFDPWLTVPDPIKVPGKPIIVNWLNRHRYGCQPKPPAMINLIQRGLTEMGVFVGLPNQHKDFERTFNCKIDFYPTSNVLECAQVIAGGEQFVGTQSMCLSLAVGLGKTYLCEPRKDVKPEQNECYFARPNAHYI